MNGNQQCRRTEAHAVEPRFAAFVGIDWSDQTSTWSLMARDATERETGVFDNRPAAIEQWAMQLHERFSGQLVAIAIEQSRGRVVYQLAKFSHLVIYIVHPNQAKDYRKLVVKSGAKSDPVDAGLLLDMLLQLRYVLRRLVPDTEQTRCLQLLVEERRHWVDEKTRCSNRLTETLKLYWPQLLDWFADIDSAMVCDLIQRWPTLEQLQRCHDGTLRRFFREHSTKSKERIQAHIEQIRAARPAITDPAISEGSASAAKHGALMILTLLGIIKDADARIAAIVETHPERSLFESLPGVGAAMLPRLIVSFGTDRNRFDNADQFQAYTGIGPVTEQSGKQRVVHWRWACSKFLRQTFQEWAALSIRSCGWARAYYDLQRSRGKSHFAAARSLAFKWIRIVFRCWKLRQPYDEQLHLRSLAKHNSPLVMGAADVQPATKLQWETVAGFSRIRAQKT